MAAALDGITVLDLSTVGPAARCTRILADYGARVVKLAHASIWETRQTEWAIEVPSETVRSPRYGNSVVGAPGDDTWLRIVKRDRGGEEHYTAYTSQDGRRWVRGGVWAHDLGPDARIGLVSMGGTGFTADFDHVRVWRLR